MKKLAFVAVALALSVSAASAAPLEGTYSGTVSQSNGSTFEQSRLKGHLKLGHGHRHNQPGQRHCDRSSRRQQPDIRQADDRTLTINGNTATLTGRNSSNGATLQGTLTKR